jgi:hypothetical protein
MPTAIASARLSAAILLEAKVPLKEVKADFGRLISSSQCMLLSCVSPSSTPTGSCVDSPSKEAYTGAHIAVEKRASNSVGRLITTKTRYRLGSPAAAVYTR